MIVVGSYIGELCRVLGTSMRHGESRSKEMFAIVDAKGNEKEERNGQKRMVIMSREERQKKYVKRNQFSFWPAPNF